MKRWFLYSFSLAICILLIGCGGSYRIGNETFSSCSEALHKQTETLTLSLQKITPIDKPVHGTVLVLIPSETEIQKNYIRFSNNPSNFNKEKIECMITFFNNHFQFMADTIRKRGIFDSVSVASHNGNPTFFPMGDSDFMVFLDVDGWFIKSKDDARSLPISFDRSLPAGATSALVFLDGLYQNANALRSK
jgi:hypothetical protein